MHLSIDEQQIVQDATKGDKSAISRLYEGYVQRIYRYISYRVDSQPIAEDLTAEVFLRMVQHLPHYRDTGVPFSAWLFRIAANQVVDYYRQNKQQRMIQALLPVDSTENDSDLLEGLEQEEERSILRQALRALTDEQQTVLILRFMDHLSHQEVSAVLNKSEVAVRVLQHRALDLLAQNLGGVRKVRSYLREDNHHG